MSARDPQVVHSVVRITKEGKLKDANRLTFYPVS